MSETASPDRSVWEELEDLLKDGKYHQAIPILHTLTGFFPDRREIVTLLGRCYLTIGSPVKSLLTLKKHEASQSEDKDLLDVLRTTYEELYLLEEATEIARRLVDLGLASEDTYHSYATSLLERGYAVEASEAVTEGLAKYPTSENLTYLRGLLFIRLNEGEKAAAVARELEAQHSPLAERLSAKLGIGQETVDEAPDTAQDLLREATQCMVKGDLDAAARKVVEAL